MSVNGVPGLSRLERWVLLAYDGALRLMQPLLRRKLARRAQQEPEYALNVAQRFGLYGGEQGTDAQVPEGGLIWLHAVSLGETRAAALLLPALRSAFPGMRLLLTHSTATGWLQGQSLLQPGDRQVWLPWDTVQATRRFLRYFKPQMGLLMETEVWPNLVQGCRQAAVPLCLINARMSDLSFQKAKRWPSLSGPAYRGLGLVLAQSQDDAQRLQALGCPSVQVVGNVKFDVTLSAEARALALRWQNGGLDRPVVMLASSREGEEALWLGALQSNPARWAQFKALGVVWLVVPRHPQRFDAVNALLMKSGLSCERRSRWQGQGPQAEHLAQVDVVLGDSVGEMQAYYLISRMALLGGSFAPLGGQNLIEAAACGCPVVMGPHTFNFSEAVSLAVRQGAAEQVLDMEAALDAVLLSLSQPERLARAQAATVQMMAMGRGAVEQHVAALLSMRTLSQPKRTP